METIYDAFISYRHVPSDMAIAEKLQTLLESCKKKDGKKLTVFRDRSDLPTSGDLGADIRDALIHTRYLIILCSPHYRESAWCMEELQFFRSLYGNSNANVLPVLVEGEPNDVFPELIRYDERETWNPDGTLGSVWVEVEPLGADVRGKNDRERKKKLKTEYLRIAAPILGVSFDELYQRAQRRRRAMASLAMAALVAFGIYTSAMIYQITDRQEKLEAKQQELIGKQQELISKQQELYTNDSIRLANQALELMAQDNALAALLVNAALPQNREDPEYPVNQESELAARSVALQHQFWEKTEYFTLCARMRFDNDQWNVGNFYGDGQYLAAFDGEVTRLFDSQTGRLVTELPGVGYHFFRGVERVTWREREDLPNGEKCVRYYVADTNTGEILAEAEVLRFPAEQYDDSFPVEGEDGTLWVARQIQDFSLENRCRYEAYGYFEGEEFIPCKTLPSELMAHCLENGATDYLNNEHSVGIWSAVVEEYQDEDYEILPPEYRKVFDAYTEVYGQQRQIESFSLILDGKLAVLQVCSLDAYKMATAFWAVEESRLLWEVEGMSFWHEPSERVYCILENELQIYKVNPENFGIQRSGDGFQIVSEDGKIGFTILENGTVNVTPTLQGGADFSEYAVYTNWSRSITPDGSRMAFEDGAGKFYVIDVEEAQVLCWADYSDERIASVALNEDGTRAACALDRDNGFEIVLFDPDGRKILDKLEIVTDYIYDPCLELAKGRLMVETEDYTWVYDIEDLTAPPWEIKMNDPSGYVEQWDTPVAFTDDGLLVIPSKVVTAYGIRKGVRAIYDLQTREEIPFSMPQSVSKADFYYDDIGGNLVFRSNNVFTLQRRGESGAFEVVYTISPRHNDMELNVTGHDCDGRYLILQNDLACEIYDLQSGELCYLLYKPQDRVSCIGFLDGCLYDFCSGRLDGGIPLLDVEDSLSYLLDTLSSDTGRRVLTDSERETYYISAQWAEK